MNDMNVGQCHDGSYQILKYLIKAWFTFIAVHIFLLAEHAVLHLTRLYCVPVGIVVSRHTEQVAQEDNEW